MIAIASRVRALGGVRAALFAVVLGLLAVSALPPLHVLPAAMVAVPLLVWRLDATRSIRGALALGWLFGLGHFAGMIYWIAYAFLVDAGHYGWMIPFAIAGMAAVLAVFPAVALGLARVFWRPGPGRILVLAGAWALSEGLRGWVLTGFPWAPIGMVWMPFDAMIQATAAVGITGLGLLTMLMLGLPALMGDEGPARRRWGALGAAALVLAVVAGGGAWRLAAHGGGGHWAADGRWIAARDGVDAGTDQGGDAGLLRVRLVQPAIPQALKWGPGRLAANFSHHLDLSTRPGLEGRDVVIWGETAVPYPINLAPEVRAALRAAVPPGGVLITGSVRRAPPGEPTQIWNSLFVVDDEGSVRGVYDKAHLVPFGEYLPLAEWLPFKKLTPGATDFSAGPGLRTLAPGPVPPFAPLICYEVIFPGRVVAAGDPAPQWMVNLTNDGWYGHSAGPYQHFQIARLRAIEEGMALVRVAGTGVSGIVSPLGRVSPVLGLDEEGILDLSVPPPLPARPLYARAGEALPLGLAGLALVVGAMVGMGLTGRSRPSTPTAIG
ncbi:apolipoprotein N-acyltransferase [Pararhodospirillum oryzae]|uniref:Apolipoprotein N-acyltransferase n=1 Tax=Pararhodospirillum oryzae TaxID=478448 RepID=A0A512H7H1_9PROT|nr:apolipoprotein N-acyltransferase [Pararhodospirillum oryzae]GEO81378.1 apolipoprotein N-acyltransferase [Pararhodospirillum oryzae]